VSGVRLDVRRSFRATWRQPPDTRYSPGARAGRSCLSRAPDQSECAGRQPAVRSAPWSPSGQVSSYCWQESRSQPFQAPQALNHAIAAATRGTRTFMRSM
jgi:hypothetical protein